MKKVSILTMLLLMCFILGNVYSLAEKSTHISQRINNTLSIEANILIPEKEMYSSYRMVIYDLTTHHTLNENALADLLFYDQESMREHIDSRDPTPGGRWGGNEVINAIGEHVSAGQTGIMTYRNDKIKSRYGDLPWYIRYSSSFMGTDMGFSEDELLRDHKFMTRDQASMICIEYLQKLAGAITPRSTAWVSISGEQLKIASEVLENLGAANKNDYILGTPLYDEWNEADDLYIIEFGFTLDGLPIYDNTTTVTLRSLSMNEIDGTIAYPLYAEFWLNRDGIISMDLYFDELYEVLETRATLSYEEAMKCLLDYLNERIISGTIEITRGYLQYIPVPTLDDPYILTLTPVWCFESDYLNDVDRIPAMTYCFSAFTGEELK